MHSRLAEILEEKRREVLQLRKRGVPGAEVEIAAAIRDFKGAVSVPTRVSVIAEIKFASPSAGIIRDKSDPVRIGKIYERAGAAAISLLTDEKFFQGDLKQLLPLKKGVAVPMLRKDFIIDEIQVRESVACGADAILLIARVLSHQQLEELLAVSRELGLAALTEVHDTSDVEKAVACGADIIGINNRDLETFRVDLRTTFALAPLLVQTHLVVSESGIKSANDIRSLREHGIHAALVGTAVMKSPDQEAKIRELVEAGKNADGKG